MARRDTHSRIVAWLKIVLPLTALGILSTVFLLSQSHDPERAIPYADVDVEALLRDQRLGEPNYSGVTRDGAAIEMRAAEVRPDPEQPSRAGAEQLTAAIELAGGGRLAIDAGTGLIDPDTSTARLDGGVVVIASDGTTVETDALTARLDRTEIVSDGAVAARSPMGDLNAGKMAIRQDAAGGMVLDFSDGVKLVYGRPTEEAE